MIRYVDASAIVALIAAQDSGRFVEPELRGAIDNAFVSDFALAESSAALARLGRVERWHQALTDFVFGELDAWAAFVVKRTEITSEDIKNANRLVRRTGISLRAPDAIHIAATQRLGAVLLTLDRGMARAAVALSVPYINPAEAEAPSATKD